MDRKEFIEFLKKGQSMEKQEDENGGFLVPQFIDIPNPGYYAGFMRFLGRLLFYFGFQSLGFIVHAKGCHPENFLEYLKSRTAGTK